MAGAQPLVTNSVAQLAAAYTTDEDRPLGIAVCTAGLFAGFLLASGAALGGRSGLHTLLLVQAGYALVGAALLTLALRTPARPVEVPVGTALAAVRAVWADRVLRTTIELVVIGFGVFVGLTTWLQALLEPYGTSAGTAVGATAAGALLLVVVHVVVGIALVLACMGLLLLLATLPVLLEVVERRAGAASGTALAFLVPAAVAACGFGVLRQVDDADLRTA